MPVRFPEALCLRNLHPQNTAGSAHAQPKSSLTPKKRFDIFDKGVNKSSSSLPTSTNDQPETNVEVNGSSNSSASTVLSQRPNAKVIQFSQMFSTPGMLMDSYFKLSISNGNEASTLFHSSTVENSLNPTWNFPPDIWKNMLLLGPFLLEVFVKSSLSSHSDHFIRLLEIEIDFSHVSFVDEQLADVTTPFPPNSTFLKFADGFYAPADPTGDQLSSEEDKPFQVNPSQVRKSYTLDNIKRLLTAQLEINLIKNQTTEIISTADALIVLGRNNSSSPLLLGLPKTPSGDIEPSSASSPALRSAIETAMFLRTQEVQTDRLRIREMKELILQRRAQLEKSESQRDLVSESLKAARSQLQEDIMSYRKVVHSLTTRQAELIDEMGLIYPIRQSPTIPGQYVILGARLPNSDYSGLDEEKVATALGHTAHLVSVIAYYLELPLRYPIQPMSSRSTISDHITKNAPGGRSFPLYLRGTERLRFDYAVFLLNKNIEQLMTHFGLRITNLRHTLPNLKSVLDAAAFIRRYDDEQRNA
ncbi:UV radiation resistance protein and autophagy-related subunit 14-domain-containing protein [Cladochytrium replicatum]|nr:UV radiation resistance protein and autophagy-related subunit 14-domain-containing protein [Cladochytrium replicatum]